MSRSYLGDGVYVDGAVRGSVVRLTTDQWLLKGDPSNTIYLEDQVIRRLLEWLQDNDYGHVFPYNEDNVADGE